MVIQHFLPTVGRTRRISIVRSRICRSNMKRIADAAPKKYAKKSLTPCTRIRCIVRRHRRRLRYRAPSSRGRKRISATTLLDKTPVDTRLEARGLGFRVGNFGWTLRLTSQPSPISSGLLGMREKCRVRIGRFCSMLHRDIWKGFGVQISKYYADDAAYM